MTTLVASAGVYSVLAFGVANRTKEIAVRMAVGCRGRSVVVLVVGEGMVGPTVGILVGLVSATALSGLLNRMLDRSMVAEPTTIVETVFVLIVTSLVACALPAARAVRIDPVVALRDE